MKTSFGVQTAGPMVDIIIVTYNNLQMLDRCCSSILQNTSEPIRIVVVNNGEQKLDVPSNAIVILNIGKNLGWTHGINYGLDWVKRNNPSPYVMWMNDDTQILPHDYGWLTKMLRCFELDAKIAAVGPVSNNIIGLQTLANVQLPPAILTSFLSGMCILTKKSIVDEMGPLNQCSNAAPGDDLDFSIRLAYKGYKLCVCRRAFMLHHCSVTARKVHGEYWNSRDQAETINTWLIKKHGFKKWYECISAPMQGWDFIAPENEFAIEELIEPINQGGMVLDLGCGGKKLNGKMIGVDFRTSNDSGIGPNSGIGSVADIHADILNMPFKDGEVDAILAKHLFEHILDPLKALKEWKRVLKDDGKLVVICPDYRYCEAISVDPSHVHAYTPDSIRSLLEVSGFEVLRTENVEMGYVFMISAVKKTLLVNSSIELSCSGLSNVQLVT